MFPSSSSCKGEANLSEGQLVHTRILQNGFHSDVQVASALVNMYGKCGILENAWMIFNEMPERDVALWNAMMSVCARYGHGKEALSLFQQMQHEGKTPDKITFICALEACSSLGALADGKLIHASINEHGFGGDLVVSNALISMYGDCGSLEDAQKVFDCMSVRDLISWNAIIGAYTNQGHKKKALLLFKEMHQSGIKPDKVTLLSILSLYTNPADLDEAKLLHVSVFHGGFLAESMIGNALILMYGKCGSVQDARKVFDEMPKKDIVSWNSMFTVYIQDEVHCRDALQLYKQMEHGNVKPDKVTLVSILNACANLADLTEGIKVHDHVLKYGMELDTFLGNALVNLYAKCGELETARMMFDRLSERDVVSWNAIIAAYAQHGQGEEALQFFKLLQKECMKPDKITFITVLSACSHAGLVDEGHQSFLSMCKELGYLPSSEHYGSMIDLFGRAGRLNEADELLNKMPFEPSAVVWMALLSACKTYGDLDRGRRAAEHAVRLDPLNDAPYIMLSNMYAAAGRWCDVAKIRGMMAKQGAKEVAGCSSIVVNS
ncbi:hypothetical protein O6H91_21G014300 [Diphasiastrum complanatum]|uniref:Uncharacterized protein n=1 Tax=Diphasiastrum complanatum TaxID=34168 RepID=A0ACC2AJC5_DIPCM|nr:hypothetical protein O6H91_21G014300 [Diphasiastrum complanatum]